MICFGSFNISAIEAICGFESEQRKCDTQAFPPNCHHSQLDDRVPRIVVTSKSISKLKLSLFCNPSFKFYDRTLCHSQTEACVKLTLCAL